jgi:hypothetical protein
MNVTATFSRYLQKHGYTVCLSMETPGSDAEPPGRQLKEYAKCSRQIVRSCVKSRT